MMMSMGSDGIEGSSAKPNIHNIDDYVPDLGGQTRYHNWIRCEFINEISQLFSVAMPDGGNPLTQEEQSEYLLWKNVFSAARHGRRNEVLLFCPCSS